MITCTVETISNKASITSTRERSGIVRTCRKLMTWVIITFVDIYEGNEIYNTLFNLEL